ncbi:hypothetical protein BD779DRAFT_408537 [Infundibulicybe gibba]|nr:hypothetical protein BD779DRAFT_408537 [Infundibulicybe gibba]
MNGQDSGSLLSRLGATNANPQPSAQSAPAATNAAPAPLFSFKPTGGEATKSSPFGAPVTSQIQVATPPVNAVPAAEKPKFNFLSPTNNNSSANGTSSGASSSSLAGALTEPAKTSANPSQFGFPAASKPMGEAKKPDTGSGLKFSFPAPTGGPAFGTTSFGGKSGEAGSGFGTANANTNGSTAFSNNASAAKPSPFASSAGFAGAGSSSSAFGKPAEKPASNPFGGASSSSTSSNIFGASAGMTNPFGVHHRAHLERWLARLLKHQSHPLRLVLPPHLGLRQQARLLLKHRSQPSYLAAHRRPHHPIHSEPQHQAKLLKPPKPRRSHSVPLHHRMARLPSRRLRLAAPHPPLRRRLLRHSSLESQQRPQRPRHRDRRLALGVHLVRNLPGARVRLGSVRLRLRQREHLAGLGVHLRHRVSRNSSEKRGELGTLVYYLAFIVLLSHIIRDGTMVGRRIELASIELASSTCV